MAPRRESRERALGLCYEREARAISADQLLDDLPAAPDAYAEELLRGVEQHEPELDGLLREYSEHWAVERMPAVDRAVLRLGCFELAHEPEVPTAVVISEAVELAKQYSTENSGRFVNGLLARIAEQVRASGVMRVACGIDRAGDDRGADRGDGGRHRPAVARHRVERPGEPDELRGVRVPAGLRVLAREGHEADARGAPRRQVGGVARDAARRPRSTSPGSTRTACGPRWSVTTRRSLRASREGRGHGATGSVEDGGARRARGRRRPGAERVRQRDRRVLRLPSTPAWISRRWCRRPRTPARRKSRARPVPVRSARSTRRPSAVRSTFREPRVEVRGRQR